MRSGANIVKSYASKGQEITSTTVNQPKPIQSSPISYVVKNSPQKSTTSSSSFGSKLGMTRHVAGTLAGAAMSAHPLGRAVRGVYRMAVSAAQDYKKKNKL